MKGNKHLQRGALAAAAMGAVLSFNGCSVPANVSSDSQLSSQDEVTSRIEESVQDSSETGASELSSDTSVEMQISNGASVVSAAESGLDEVFVPSDNIPEDVYGPPVVEESDPVLDESIIKEESDDTDMYFNPDDNIPMTVYGPAIADE